MEVKTYLSLSLAILLQLINQRSWSFWDLSQRFLQAHFLDGGKLCEGSGEGIKLEDRLESLAQIVELNW